jgi:hypothetical protein
VLLPSVIRGRIEPWIRPAALLLIAAFLLAFGPHRDRVRAGVFYGFPYPNADRLATFRIYINVRGGPFLPAMEVARQMDSIEQLAGIREYVVEHKGRGALVLEATDDLDEVLSPLPRSLVFPHSEITLPWSNPPVQRFDIVARLKPGVSISQVRKELRARPEFRWVTSESLAARSLYRPWFPALFWTIPVLLLVWRMGEDFRKDRRLIRFRLYSVLNVASFGVLSAVVWVAGMETGTSIFTPGSTEIILFFTIFPIAWLLTFTLALLRTGEDLQNRCRTCMKRLRLPLEEGEWGALLVRPQMIHSMCPWGHGQLVVDRLDVHWTFSGNMWEELEASARK